MWSLIGELPDCRVVWRAPPSDAPHRAVTLASNSSKRKGRIVPVPCLALDWAVGTGDLVGCNLLRHREQEFSIPLRCLRQKTTQLCQKASIFARRAPCDVRRGLSLGEVGKLGRLVAVKKELVDGHL